MSGLQNFCQLWSSNSIVPGCSLQSGQNIQKFISLFCRNIDPLFVHGDKFLYKSVAVHVINCQKYDYAFFQGFNAAQHTSLTMNIFQACLKLLLLGQFFFSVWKYEGTGHEREVELKKELYDKAKGVWRKNPIVCCQDTSDWSERRLQKFLTRNLISP